MNRDAHSLDYRVSSNEDVEHLYNILLSFHS